MCEMILDLHKMTLEMMLYNRFTSGKGNLKILKNGCMAKLLKRLLL